MPTLPAMPMSIRRTPHGVRGLKFATATPLDYEISSHPSRGARIEIPINDAASQNEKSHPSRGAWIEIPVYPYQEVGAQCRTPHGVRGLKFDRLYLTVTDSGRTPHGVRGLKSPC